MRFVGICAGILCTLTFATAASAVETVIDSPVRGQVNRGEMTLSFNPGALTLATDVEDPSELGNWAAMHFPLDDIPTDADILSAVLVVDFALAQSPNSPVLDFHGYAGDATIDEDDVVAPDNLIGTSDPIANLGTMEITLDDNFVESLLGSATHLGIRTALSAGTGTSFWSGTPGEPPTLIVNYVPEPATLLLLAGGVVGLRRRR